MGSIDAIRKFNRFYTRRIGVLQEGLLHSPFTLTEARVLFELANRTEPTASSLAADLGLDPGYLSRILRRFERRGLMSRVPSSHDRRQVLLTLTEDGRTAFAAIDTASRDDLAGLLAPLNDSARKRLVEAMGTITRLLGDPEVSAPIVLRPPEAGDLGWVVARHGVLYAREYGWDETFEGLVAEIVATWARGHDPERERCWIADRRGQKLGSVFLVRHPERADTAKLRLLLVEPEARGLGVGGMLVGECTRFARAAGYQRIVLWTNSVLHAARRLYQREGYTLVEEEPHHAFGHDLVSQTWELVLPPA